MLQRLHRGIRTDVDILDVHDPCPVAHLLGRDVIGQDGVVRAGLVAPLDGLLACHSALRAAVQGSLRARAACHPRLIAGYEH